MAGRGRLKCGPISRTRVALAKAEAQGMTPIASIRVGHRHRKDPGDIAALAASIDDVGRMHPIVITLDGRLIAGERRLLAARLGLDRIATTVVRLRTLRGASTPNAMRKQFTPSEQVGSGARWRPSTEAADETASQSEAMHREAETGPLGQTAGRATKWRTISARPTETFCKQIQVVQAAEAEPENRSAPGRHGPDGQGQRAAQAAHCPTQGRGHCSGAAAASWARPLSRNRRRPALAYELGDEQPSSRGLPVPTMTVDGIKALPVGEIAAPEFYPVAMDDHFSDGPRLRGGGRVGIQTHKQF